MIVAYKHIAQLSADNPPVGCTRDEVDQPDNSIYYQIITWHITEIALFSEKEMYKMGEKEGNVQSVTHILFVNMNNCWLHLLRWSNELFQNFGFFFFLEEV